MDEQQGIFPTGIIPHYNTVIFTAICLFIAVIIWRKRRPKLKSPPGPWCLPIVGYVPFLGKEPFRTLDNLSKKYGNVFSLQMGRTYVVILGDFEAVKEAFKNPDTADRPPGIFNLLPDGAGLASVNGKEWVEQRRFCMRMIREIGNFKSPWLRLLEEEVSDLIQSIQTYNGKPLNINKPLTSSISNTIAALVFGKRFPFEHPDRHRLDQGTDAVYEAFSKAGLYAWFPWLVYILIKLNIGVYAKLFEQLKGFNNFIRKEIALQKKQKKSSANHFIKGYLEEMEEQQKTDSQTTYNEKNLIGNTQTIFDAGNDTTEASLTWLMLAMAAHPDIQKKVHIELDSVLGEDQMPTWEDRSRLLYTYAVIMETFRWKTVVPLNSGRLAREDVSVGGFVIPKGSTIIANNWALHNDARYWKDAENFIPERFLQNGGKDINFRPESYVPFSYGKRSCPGESMAVMEVFLYFTNLMKVFEVRSPRRKGPCLDGVLGLTYKAVEQELCFITRLSQ